MKTTLTMDTLYKSGVPERLERRDRPEDFSPAEYRQLAVKQVVDSAGAVSYILVLYQGWWDEAEKEPKHGRQLMEAPYDSQSAAEEAYRILADSLISQGYIYAFIHPGPFGQDVRVKYRVLKPLVA
jgi:hypothetical protein